jgi:hypothetical protein
MTVPSMPQPAQLDQHTITTDEIVLGWTPTRTCTSRR